MRENIESILVSSVIELDGNNEKVIVDAFNSAVGLLLHDESIFEEVPEHVYISSSSLSDVDKKAGSGPGLARDSVTNFGKDVENTITYYDGKAVLLHDGLHGSAFGRMSYIYRSKGIRVYFFDYKEMKVVTPYCYIDHHGFQLDNESWDFDDWSVSGLNNPEALQSFFSLFTGDFNNRAEKRFICRELIKILCNIKMPFHKDYYLEYLLTPPDVDKLSDFSLEIRKTFWDICLSQDFVERWGKDVQNISMNILSTVGIAPSTNQLVSYINQKDKNDSFKADLILERINQIETNIVNVVKESTASDVSDIFDIKPNIWGIGINGNEIYARLRDWWNKKSA